MIISRDLLSTMAKRFLETLKIRDIHDMIDVKNEIGSRHTVSDQEREFVQIDIRPSNGLPTSYAISYILGELGVPIEARINPSLGYTLMIAKAEEEILGYKPFHQDHFGNLQQMKKLRSAKMEVVRRELTTL